ncbi:uncharacterized protein LOC105219693 [Zeugodacus cucurbitae]|uniref:uncharacterized protein LOC105219693 n=1 Tax=Zeugodacus cucurbitae TaxID=28588 RepID=UPI0023D95CB4|nr:uncharacterized protein LOC105219693 [Zeugodacus cucurbitae]
MKPNRKESVAPVCTKKTSTIGTITATAVAVDAPKHDEPLQNLRENVTFIGWMGIIASATLLLCSGLTMQWQHEVVRYMMLVLRKSAEMERSRAMLRRVVMTVSVSAYFLSAINVLMNMFLLTGVAKLNHKLMLPWLLFHGVIFGFFGHIGLYMLVSSLLLDFKIFVLLLASFTMIIMIFYKITFEVFNLCKTIRRNSLTKEQSALNEEENKNSYLVLQSEA